MELVGSWSAWDKQIGSKELEVGWYGEKILAAPSKIIYFNSSVKITNERMHHPEVQWSDRFVLCVLVRDLICDDS